MTARILPFPTREPRMTTETEAFVLKVRSDEYPAGQLMTPQLYSELRLRMSTGDFHTHRAIRIPLSSLKPLDRVLHLYAEDWTRRLDLGMSEQEAWDASVEQVTVHRIRQWGCNHGGDV